jgi:transcriptional regulator, cro/CI family
MTSFTNRLVQLRKKRGLTQQQIADEIGVNRGSYSNWEKGKREPSFENLIKLADILDTTTDFLLGKSNINFGNNSEVYEEYKKLLSQNKKEEIQENYDHSFEFTIKAIAKELGISVEEALNKIIQNIGNNSETTETK